MTPMIWCGVLGDIIYNSNVGVSYIELGILYFMSDIEFVIQSMSYNIRLLCGLEESQFPLVSFYLPLAMRYGYYIYRYGCYNSTPIFYLMSNWGANNFLQDINGIVQGKTIFMKISNAATANVPIVYSGGDQKRILRLSELSSNVEFIITDSNEVKLDLLDKLYLTLRIRFLKFEQNEIKIYSRSILGNRSSPPQTTNPEEIET